MVDYYIKIECYTVRTNKFIEELHFNYPSSILRYYHKYISLEILKDSDYYTEIKRYTVSDTVRTHSFIEKLDLLNYLSSILRY